MIPDVRFPIGFRIRFPYASVYASHTLPRREAHLLPEEALKRPARAFPLGGYIEVPPQQKGRL